MKRKGFPLELSLLIIIGACIFLAGCYKNATVEETASLAEPQLSSKNADIIRCIISDVTVDDQWIDSGKPTLFHFRIKVDYYVDPAECIDSPSDSRCWCRSHPAGEPWGSWNYLGNPPILNYTEVGGGAAYFITTGNGTTSVTYQYCYQIKVADSDWSSPKVVTVSWAL